MSDIPFSIGDSKSHTDSTPKSGRVTEVCKEWLVREDGALAYRLQAQEINEHYSSNKSRNAQVREDFPCAYVEQLKEQKLAEQAAAVYHKMLAEQEEIDNKIAKELAAKLEKEEIAKRHAIERKDEEMARRLLEKNNLRQPTVLKEYKHNSPQKPSTSQQSSINYLSPQKNMNYSNSPKRQGVLMPLPSSKGSESNNSSRNNLNKNNFEENQTLNCLEPLDLYSEPYRNYENLEEQFDRTSIDNIELPLDEIIKRKIQEEKDEELARQLQKEEGLPEDAIINRDRLLAIEAQDKELAKLLQERERAKAKRAKERAKQRALAKKQLQQLNQETEVIRVTDDAYSIPVDVIPQEQVNTNYSEVVPHSGNVLNIQNDDDISYSFPADIVSKAGYDKSSTQRNGLKTDLDNPQGYAIFTANKGVNKDICPTRPTQLDLRSPLTKQMKSKCTKPDLCEIRTPHQKISPSHAGQHINIAMAIDPTYTRRNAKQSPLSFDTTSSTVTTSTSSSSPGNLLSHDVIEHEDDTSPVPPYMPIQGQRRTLSLEKKKKKPKDGCKQQ